MPLCRRHLPGIGDAEGAAHATCQHLECGLAVARQFGVAVQLAGAEHEPETPRMAQREVHIGQSLLAQRGHRVGSSACIARNERLRQALEAQRCHRRQQARGVAEVVRWRGRRDAGAACHLAQRETVGAALGQQRLGGLDQRFAQRAVVVGQGRVRHRRAW